MRGNPPKVLKETEKKVKKIVKSKEEKGKSGRPPINEPTDEQAIQEKIDLYFEELKYIDADGFEQMRDSTYCGLALALGYASRQSLWENSNSGSNISLPIKKALLRIEESYERGLRNQACTGSIFALKNKGWTDKTEIEHSGGVTVMATPTDEKL